MSLPKEQNSTRVKLINLFVNSCDDKLFPLMMLISSLFICLPEQISQDSISLKGLKCLLSYTSNILTNPKIDKEAFITESSPKLVFLLNNNLGFTKGIQSEEMSNKELLDLTLRKSTKENEISELILKYFPDRKLYNLSTDSALIQSLSKESKPKKIKGKIFNGSSLVYLINNFTKLLNEGNTPNINNLWDSLIKKDLEYFYEKAMVIYKQRIAILDSVLEGEELIKLLYDFKLESMTTYNKVFYFNQDTFNSSQYQAIYNEYKRKVEAEISNLETKIYDKNLESSSKMCRELVNKAYGNIKNKIKNQAYTSTNSSDYLKDHEDFLNIYSAGAKGPQKVNILVDFLVDNKPEVIKTFVKSLEDENNSKLEEVMKNVNVAEKKKVEVEARKRNLDEISQNNNEKIENLNSELEKKKRDIIDLSERIRLMENEIREKREESQKK